MSNIYSYKRTIRRGGHSPEQRKGRALKRLALKAYFAGEEGRADELLDMSNYWQARAMLNVDKAFAVDGAVIKVDQS